MLCFRVIADLLAYEYHRSLHALNQCANADAGENRIECMRNLVCYANTSNNLAVITSLIYFLPRNE